MTQSADVVHSSWPILNLWRYQLPLKDLVLFTRQLATLLEGGLPLAQVLSILASQSESKRLSRLVTHVHGKIQDGLALAAALRTSPSQKACGNWRWQSAALWSLNLEWQVTAKIGETQAFLLTQINDNQWLVNGLLKLPDTEPAPQWAQWLPAGTQAGEKKVNFSGKW